MKKSFIIRVLAIILVITLNFCKREYVEYNNLTTKEREILTKADTLFPAEITNMIETSFTEISEENRDIMLDSLNLALDSLMITISATSGVEEYKKTMSNTLANFNNFKSSQSNACLGLSYAKSAGIATGVTSTMGIIVALAISESVGGGINVVYDFVNLDRQIYCYKVCTYNYSYGVGAGIAFTAGVGFTGLRKLTTGIRYHGGTSGINKFAGLSLGKSYALTGNLMTILGLSTTIGVGTTQSAVGSFSQNNLYPCPENLTLIENGTKGFYFQVSGNLSVGAAADILLAYKSGESGSQSRGIANSYTNFSNVRVIAGTRMARELLLGMPIKGIECGSDPIDRAASCLAIIYCLKQFDQCPAEIPAIGTTAIENITSTTAIGGGVITDIRGSDISARGLCWSISHDPTINDNHTNNGVGVGSYNGNLTGLVGGVRYYVRAYATNSAGTGYGAEVKFTTQSSGGLPVSAFSAIPTSGPKPLIVNFTDQSTNNPTSWQWDFGDGNTSTLQSPTHTYQNAGSYTVKLAVTNSYGSDTETKSNYITVTNTVSAPVADFIGNPTSGIKPLVVNFSDQSNNSPTSWQWNFGDGNTSTLQSPSHTYQNAGSYTVQLAATNSYGTDTEMKSNYITVTNTGSAPVADFSGNPTSGIKPLVVNFSDQSTNSPTSWEWDFGDGGTSNLQNPSHIYQNEGYYSVILTVSNSHGNDTEVKNNYISVTSGGSTGTFTDPRDGQTYATVDIGSQTWFAENLNYETSNSWWYDNSSANGDIYGRLYTWDAALNACPSGWHLPSDDEWTTLTDYLGGASVAGGKMKEAGTAHWNSPNTGATNTSGFTALPGGYRPSSGSFNYLGSSGLWWSATETSGTYAWRRNLDYDHDQVSRLYYNKTGGFSVRCLKD